MGEGGTQGLDIVTILVSTEAGRQRWCDSSHHTSAVCSLSAHAEV